MKIGLLGGLLAALLAVLGGGGDWDANDGPPEPTVCPEEPCGVHLPPPARRP